MRSGSRPRLRRPAFVAVGLFSVTLALSAHTAGLMQRLGNDTVDIRFHLRGPQPPPSDLVVVAIDEATFTDLPQRWPFPRSVHAEAIERIKAAGAKVIAYDVPFTGETEPSEDAALLDAIGRSGPVILSTTEATAGDADVLGGGDVVRRVGGRVGNALIRLDSAAVSRTVPFRVDGLESFAVVTARVADGRPVPRSRFTLREGRAWIDFVGPPGRIPTVSFGDVLGGRIAPGAFRGKIVVVGGAALTLQDTHPTPTTVGAGMMAGPEIQANAIQTVRRGLPLQTTPNWSTVVSIVILALATPVMAVWLRFRWSLLLTAVLAVAFLGLAVVLFSVGLVMPVVVPMVGLGFAVVLSIAGHALLSATERQRTRDLFARFVPEAVVDEVLAKADGDLRLGGQRRQGTVLFSDLRGFTSFAERLSPDLVIEVLNHYLSEMSDAIMEHEGTLVAFMGDGIMAVFGAPLDRPDHADQALRAAEEMFAVRLPRFNRWLRDQGLRHEFRMGIGLNSGEVMSGNVGSSTRVEYTAIGDTTNTAARIESMTVSEGRQLLLSGATRAALLDDALRSTLEAVGERTVRGREQSLTLWTLPTVDGTPMNDDGART